MSKLFSDWPWAEVEHRKRAQLKSEINAWDGNQLLNTSVDDLCKYLVQGYSVDIPILNRNEIKKDYEDTRVDVSRDPKYTTDDQSGPVYVQGVRIEISVPYTGESSAFSYQPTTHTLNPPRAHVSRDGRHLILVITGANLEPDTVLQRIDDTLDKIDNYLTFLREDADKLSGDLDFIVRQYIEERREDLLKNRDLFASLPFKLKERDNSTKTYIAPEVSRNITPKPPQTSSQPYQLEPTLDEADYEHILKVIGNMAQVMEYNPDAFSKMGEEPLRWHFLVQLNGHYEGQATGETFNFQGKTDILIKSEGKNIFIAECKYWGRF